MPLEEEKQATGAVKESGSKRKKTTAVSLVQRVVDDPVRTVRTLISVTEPKLLERKAAWDRYRRKYRRGLFYLRSLNDGVPLYFTNYIFANVEATKANITRNLPALNASPRGLRDDLAADVMSRVLENALYDGGLYEAVQEVVHHALITSMGWFKVFFDPDLDGVRVIAVPPDDVYVDPAARCMHDIRWIIHRRRNIPVDQIEAQYGVRPKVSREGQEGLVDREGTNDQSAYGTEDLSAAEAVTKSFDVWECWVRSWEPDRENDWYIVTIAGDTVLRSEYSVYAHNQTPFWPWFDVEDFSAETIYKRGVGSVEEIEPLQDRADSLDLRIYKNISLLANRQRYVSAQSGLSVTMLDTTAGRSYQVNGDPTKAVYYDSPPQLSAEVYNYRNQTEVLIQTVSGIFDVTQGRRPVGITAGRAIESLKDSAETRLAAKVESLAKALEQVGRLALEIILQFYDGMRIIRATDVDQDKDFIVVDDYPPELQPTQLVPEVDEEGNQVVDAQGNPVMREPTEEELENMPEPEIDPALQEARKLWKEQNGIALVLSDVKYAWDVRANTDSALPSARAERAQIAADLFRLGVIDREALLEAIDYPQRHKILQRMAGNVTGQNAGDPMAESGMSGVEGVTQQLMQLLVQMGMDEQQAAQVIQQMLGGRGGGASMPNAPGGRMQTTPPRAVM